jgi:hypothetical protein
VPRVYVSTVGRNGHVIIAALRIFSFMFSKNFGIYAIMKSVLMMIRLSKNHRKLRLA